MALPQLHLCFDVAQGFPFQFHLRKYFITHGHLDHAAGIPYLISQKAMNSLAPGDFFMPASLVEPLDKIMQLWQQIEGHEYKYHFHPTRPKDLIEIDKHHCVRAFQTVHRIESLGYTVFKKNKKLKPQYSGLSETELIDLRKKGAAIQEEYENPLVSFTGDTQIEFLFKEDWIRKSKILIMESTYLDQVKSVEHARRWGHTHLDEILNHLDEIESERIVLIHTSSRYSWEHAKALLKERIPAKHADRVVLFPGR